MIYLVVASNKTRLERWEMWLKSDIYMYCCLYAKVSLTNAHMYML